MPSACIFCDIVQRKRPASVVYEDDQTLAFMDLRQPVPGHVLVVPKRHAEAVYDLDEATGARLARAVLRVSRAIRATLSPAGLSIWQSNGRAAGQEVPHLHVHLQPREVGDGLLRAYTQVPTTYGPGALDALAERIAHGLVNQSGEL